MNTKNLFIFLLVLGISLNNTLVADTTKTLGQSLKENINLLGKSTAGGALICALTPGETLLNRVPVSLLHRVAIRSVGGARIGFTCGLVVAGINQIYDIAKITKNKIQS